jgi:hypothetical protein
MSVLKPLEDDAADLLYGLTPNEVVTACGQFVTITLSNNEDQSGYLYTIDPISGTVILKHEAKDKAIVILRHHVQSIKSKLRRNIYFIWRLHDTRLLMFLFYLRLSVHGDHRLSEAQLENLFATDAGAEDLRNDSAAMRQRKQEAIQLLEAVKIKIRKIHSLIMSMAYRKKAKSNFKTCLLESRANQIQH